MSARIRFGVYELDRDAPELSKHGVPVRLQQQPLRVLVMLTERPGEIVTREQLQERIWGTTFVDFEHSLNKAINRLREALNDNAGAPQFIETIPRRGYRFIAAVAPGRRTELPQATEAVNTVVTEVPIPPKVKPSPLRVVAIVVPVIASVLAGLYAMIATGHYSRPAVQEARLIASFGYSPVISRDGKLLAYSSSIGSGPLHIWIQQNSRGRSDPGYLRPFLGCWG
jgi:DNA-binding winged helix-turn-helix (wHTH) protein